MINMNSLIKNSINYQFEELIKIFNIERKLRIYIVHNYCKYYKKRKY